MTRVIIETIIRDYSAFSTNRYIVNYSRGQKQGAHRIYMSPEIYEDRNNPRVEKMLADMIERDLAMKLESDK